LGGYLKDIKEDDLSQKKHLFLLIGRITTAVLQLKNSNHKETKTEEARKRGLKQKKDKILLLRRGTTKG